MQSSELALAQRRKAASIGRTQIEENRRQRRELWKAEAKELWEQWHGDPFFALGIGLYWGEGSKHAKAAQLQLTNSDVNMLRVWLRWCHRFLPGVPLKCLLCIHDNCDREFALQFWKQQLGVDVKCVWVAVSSASKRKRNTLPYGTLHVRVGRGSLEWFTKMLVWLELFQEL
jgi:hypothetical protein